MSGPMAFSAAGDVVSIGGSMVIGADVVSTGDDPLGIGGDVIRPIGNIMHKHRQA
jgi:hypothetical protein